MNYKEKKEELIKARKQIFEDYRKLYLKVIGYSVKLNTLQGKITTISEHNDFADFICNDEGMIKLTSLACALMYVEDPGNAEIRKKLIDDIRLYENEFGMGKK